MVKGMCWHLLHRWIRNLRVKSKAYFLFFIYLLNSFPPTYGATGTENLDRFFNQVRTYTAEFEQVVLDETLKVIETSSGKMWLERPGKFRWDYAAPLAQEIVSDGTKIWIYDVDLENVQVRALSDALGDTPAMVLAGKGDIRSNYELAEIGPQGDTTWVALIPKSKESAFEYVRLGFSDSELSILELVDGLGQTTRITMSDVKINSSVKSSVFEFEVPEGVDVIDEN